MTRLHVATVEHALPSRGGDSVVTALFLSDSVPCRICVVPSARTSATLRGMTMVSSSQVHSRSTAVAHLSQGWTAPPPHDVSALLAEARRARTIAHDIRQASREILIQPEGRRRILVGRS